MKLKFYLRGLGIGIVVTALLMGYTGGRQKTTEMTDEQIIARAEALGMVQEARVLLPTSETAEGEIAAHSMDVNTAEEAEAADDVKAAAEQTEVPAEEEKNSSIVTLEIAKGSGSAAVSALLEKGGFVENAGEFDHYLCEYNYDNRIVAGIHQIPLDADFETIAKIITER
ncbi:MAG: hypothetical protein QM697_17320 [Lachnospiraceae bacterium]